MLAPWGRRGALPFPFNRGNTEYYYLARNGICALARAWGLAGQQVLAPAYCHGVEIEALLHSGANLHFFPVRAGMEVRAEDVISRVTPHTRAVYLIHYVGFPGPVQQLAVFCRDNNILLVEDCALALLSKLGDLPLGSFGDAAIFCLYKTLPLPNGGAVVINTEAPPCTPALRPPPLSSTLAYTMSALFRDEHLDNGNGDSKHSFMARVRAGAKPVFEKFGLVKVGTNHLEATHLGLGMSSICWRMIATQDFNHIVECRRRNYLHLLSRLKGIANIVFSELPAGVCPLFFAIQTPHKLLLRERLLARGIETVNLWALDAPGVQPGEYPEVDHLRRTILELPCHQDLTPEAMDWISDEVCRLRPYL